jgi:hypothetical protein
MLLKQRNIGRLRWAGNVARARRSRKARRIVTSKYASDLRVKLTWIPDVKTVRGCEYSNGVRYYRRYSASSFTPAFKRVAITAKLYKNFRHYITHKFFFATTVCANETKIHSDRLMFTPSWGEGVEIKTKKRVGSGTTLTAHYL